MGFVDAQREARIHVLVLGTADWNQPIATNQHYIVRELCRDGFARVTFLESMALRRPQFTRRDLSRVARRINDALFRKRRPSRVEWRSRPDGLDVRSPLVIPIHRGWLSTPNRLLLRSKIRDWLSDTGPKVLWSYSPVTYGLEEHADAVVYHCVDLLGKFPGIDPTAISRGERQLASFGASAAATSRVVQQHLRHQGFDKVALWENVADTDSIGAAGPQDATRVPGRVIFAGNLSPNKIDYQILEALADAGLDVCVAGPRAEGGGNDSRQFDSLLAHGVTYLGMLTLEELSTELVQASVGIIPYVINDYTRGVSPLKTYEYLAAGLPVVSTDIPGVARAPEQDIWVERDTASFVQRTLELARASSTEAVLSRIKSAAPHSWSARGIQARRLVTESLTK